MAIHLVLWGSGWMTNELWFDSWQGQKIFLFSKSPDWLGAHLASYSLGSRSSM